MNICFRWFASTIAVKEFRFFSPLFYSLFFLLSSLSPFFYVIFLWFISKSWFWTFMQISLLWFVLCCRFFSSYMFMYIFFFFFFPELFSVYKIWLSWNSPCRPRISLSLEIDLFFLKVVIKGVSHCYLYVLSIYNLI